ncbi:PR-1-like protein, partial [Lichtheimia hyalospora FSU 10163]
VIAVHNKFRKLHGSPPLTWDDNLATYAVQWSKECVIKHSGGPYGENIAKGPGTWEEAITDWYNEQAQYDFSNPGWTEETGHFSQLIWKSTSKVGCGAVYCPNLGGNY